MSLHDKFGLAGDASDFLRAVINSIWSFDYIRKKSIKIDRVVHCHIPKTAGVSFYSHFKPHMKNFHADHRDVSGSLDDFFSNPDLDVKFFTGHFAAYDVVSRLPGISLIVCPIRHPIERLISNYNYNCSEKHPWNAEFKKKFPDINTFMKSEHYASNPMCRQLFSGFDVDCDGFFTKDGLRPIFYLSSQDHYPAYLKRLMQLCSIKEAKKPNVLNVTEAKDRSYNESDLDKDVVDKVKNNNKEDLMFYWAVKKASDIYSSLV